MHLRHVLLLLLLLLMFFLVVLANQLKGALPTPTDLECGVNIDLVERRIYIHNKKKKLNYYNIYYIYIYILGVAWYMYSYRIVTVQASRFGA